MAGLPYESYVDGMDSEDEEEECGGREPPLPEWANSYEAVPPQHGPSRIASAAFQLRHAKHDVPMPMGFEHKKRRQSHPEIAKALDPQTELVLDAYLAQRCLTGLVRDADLERLEAAERAELWAAASLHDRDALAAHPRAFALTVIVRDAALCRFRAALLDAAAYWAHYGGNEEGGYAAARVCRMTILANEHAKAYAKRAGAGRAEGNEELLLSYLEPPEQEGGDARRKTVRAALPCAETAKKCLDHLVRIAAQLFVEAEQEPPIEIVRCIDAEEDQVHDAYTASIKEATDAFWQRVLQPVPFEPIDIKLDFEHHRTFVKLVPIPGPNQPPPEQFAFGILTYAEGMHEEARDYCINATREEKRNHPHRPPNAPYGLRYPLNSAEHALRMHVFEVSCGLASFAHEVSCFALRTAPGKPVCVYPNASVCSLRFQLVPFDEVFCRDKYVLPVTQTQVDSNNLYEHNPQWAAVELGVSKFRHAWGLEAGDRDEPSHFKPTRDYRPLSKEEELAASLFGVARCSSACLSDVYAKFQKLGCEVSPLSRFLTAAIAQHGPGASLVDALENMATAASEREAERKTMEQREQRLEMEKERLRELAPKKPVIESVKEELVPTIMAALGRKPKKGRVIPEPVVNGAVTAVVFAYACARGVAEDKTEARWGKKNVGALPTFEAISKVVGQLDACPTVFMRINADGSADFLRALNEGRPAERITVLQALELSRSPDVAFLQFQVNEVKLSPLLRERP